MAIGTVQVAFANLIEVLTIMSANHGTGEREFWVKVHAGHATGVLQCIEKAEKAIDEMNLAALDVATAG